MLAKICGLSDPLDVAAAVRGGARYLGFVHYPKSPRHVSLDRARELMLAAPEGVCKVVLTVDADDALLSDITRSLPVDMLQLHGRETPERVAEIRKLSGLPVMKAVGVAGADDLAALDLHARVADQLLVDAKPVETSALPGGNGLTFDWRLIANRRWPIPWMLAGGLNPANVALAGEMTGARQVDVSSGVESAPGIKDRRLIAAFLAATR